MAASRLYSNVNQAGTFLKDTPHPEDTTIRPFASISPHLLSARVKIWNAFTEPTSSDLAFFISTAMITTVAISTILLCIESMPRYQDNPTAKQVSECEHLVSCENGTDLFCCVFLMKSLRCEYQDNPTAKQVIGYIEAVCIGIFSVEYVAKLATAPNRRSFIVDVVNIVDLISVLPWYLDLTTCGFLQTCSGSSGLKSTRVRAAPCTSAVRPVC